MPEMVMRPTEFPSCSVNHRFPSGPAVMSYGNVPGVGILNSEITPDMARVYRDRRGRIRIDWRIENDNDTVGIAYRLDPVMASTFFLFVDARNAVRMSGPQSGGLRVGFSGIGHVLADRKWQTQTETLAYLDLASAPSAGLWN